MKPNFFIVGAPKCSTTSMYHYLKQHPDIFMPEAKEPHHFDTDHHESSDKFHGEKLFYDYRDREDYLSLFSEADADIIGEGSTRYLHSKVAAQNIHDFNSDAKILILLREPVSMMESWHKQMVRSNSENVVDFHKAYKLKEKRAKGKALYSNTINPEFLIYADMADYGRQVKRYLDRFDNVKIVVFEDFIESTEEIYVEVLDFLGVDTDFNPDFKVYNKRSGIRSVMINKIVKNPIWRKILSKIGLYEYLKPIGRKLASLNSTNSDFKEIPDSVRNELKKDMYEKVEYLDKMIDKNVLNKWE